MERLAAGVVGGHSLVDKSGVKVFQLGLHSRVDEVEGTSALVPEDLAVFVKTVAVCNHAAYDALLVKESDASHGSKVVAKESKALSEP